MDGERHVYEKMRIESDVYKREMGVAKGRYRERCV